jgi:hypothetical protein
VPLGHRLGAVETPPGLGEVAGPGQPAQHLERLTRRRRLTGRLGTGQRRLGPNRRRRVVARLERDQRRQRIRPDPEAAGRRLSGQGSVDPHQRRRRLRKPSRRHRGPGQRQPCGDRPVERRANRLQRAQQPVPDGQRALRVTGQRQRVDQRLLGGGGGVEVTRRLADRVVEQHRGRGQRTPRGGRPAGGHEQLGGAYPPAGGDRQPRRQVAPRGG